MQPTQQKLVHHFLLALIFTVLLSNFVYHLKFITNFIKTGDYSLPISAKPFYGFMQVPGTASQNMKIEDNGAGNNLWHKLGMIETETVIKPKNALGADFSQVYFSATALRHGESQYNPETTRFRDRFLRKPNYPPLTNWIYTPLSLLTYHNALIIHNYLSLCIFLFLAGFILKILNLKEYILKTFILLLLLYFYTPIGLSHFERGQFDMWLASSYMLLFCSIFLKKHHFLTTFASGLMGALKWSSLPFIGTFSATAFLLAPSKKRWAFLIPGLVFLLSILLFFPGIREYWPSLELYEFTAEPDGVSFMYFMPRAFAKIFQIICCLIVIILCFTLRKGPENRADLFSRISFPFAMAMFIQGMCFGTISFEYRMVSMFGLIPAFILWLALAETVPAKIKLSTAFLFGTFIIISFRIFHYLIWDMPTLNSPAMSAFYITSSIIFLFQTCFLILNKP